ncbi:MAG: hypothetical protein HQL74_13135 [Magnetococcales bacterium]|nr:hypothetical protein [Magnetococcales bacterium]
MKKLPTEKGAVTADRLIVTPHMATEWLEKNQHNRHIRQSHVDHLAQQLRNGSWKLDGATICFDTDGNILDGQHRLWAVIESGSSIETLVVTGLESDVFPVIDTGIVRTGADVLSRLDLNPQERRTASTAVGWIIRYRAKKCQSSIKVSNQEVFDFVSNTPGLRSNIHFAHQFTYQERLLPKGITCFLHFLMAKKEEQLATKFFSKTFCGNEIKADTPIFHLRNALLADRISKRKPRLYSQVATTIKAWNHLRNGTTVKRQGGIRWLDTEKFPEVL